MQKIDIIKKIWNSILGIETLADNRKEGVMKDQSKWEGLKTSLLLLAILLFLPLWIIFAKIAKRIPTKVLRYRGNALQTPIVFYKNPKTRRQVIFIAVAHLGEVEYFPILQGIIDKHSDHTVLYELVGKLTTEQQAALTPAENLLLEKLKVSHKLVEAVTKLLGLTYQKEGLIYREHWINTDMAMIDLLRLLVEEKVDFFKNPDGVFALEENPFLGRWLINVALSNLVPLLLATRFSSYLFRVGRREQRILIDRRNEIASRSIFEHLKEQDVLTIWGAEHLPGIDKNLRAAGFREEYREWIDAYRPRKYRLSEVIQDIRKGREEER